MAELDLTKFPRAACSKHKYEKPHTGYNDHCIDCGKWVVKKTDPDRWELHDTETD